MFACLKGFRIAVVMVLAAALAACTTVTPEQYKRMSSRQKAQLQYQRQQEAAAIGLLAVAAIAGVSIAANNRGSRYYRVHDYRSSQRYRSGRVDRRCEPIYGTPNPGGNGWGPGNMCLGN